jgi:integrase
MPAITLRTVQSLALGATTWDDNPRGFGVRRQRGDPFYVLKCRIAGRQRFLTIGRHGSPWTPDSARREARRLLGLIAAGQDPTPTPKVASLALASVAESYLRHAQSHQKPRTFVEVQRYLLGAWEPLRDRPLAEISRAHVAAQLRSLAEDRGPVAATHARAALSAMFNWAIGEGLADANPVTGTNRAPAFARDRVLTDDELRAVWRACGDDDYGRIVRLLLLSGQRRNEVGGMRWAELDLARGVWTIPAARTKNRREHIVPLSAAMLSLIPEPPAPSREAVFGHPQRGWSGWSKAKAALDWRIGDGTIGDPWRLHDLRRTAATMMADRLGVLPHIIEAVLNHASGHRAGVAGIYNRASYSAEMRRALDLWGEYVGGLVEGLAPKVVALWGRGA